MISGDTTSEDTQETVPSDSATSNSSATATDHDNVSIVIPPSDITIKNSSSSSTGWAQHEKLNPDGSSPIIEEKIAEGNRPMVNSPIVSISKENPTASSYNKRQAAAAANGVVESYVPAGIAIHLMFPGLSAASLQDVYVTEPPVGKSFVINKDVVIPLNYKIGSGVTAQTVGPVHVQVHASANEA